jgi:hypothetical protein
MHNNRILDVSRNPDIKTMQRTILKPELAGKSTGFAFLPNHFSVEAAKLGTLGWLHAEAKGANNQGYNTTQHRRVLLPKQFVRLVLS